MSLGQRQVNAMQIGASHRFSPSRAMHAAKNYVTATRTQSLTRGKAGKGGGVPCACRQSPVHGSPQGHARFEVDVSQRLDAVGDGRRHGLVDAALVACLKVPRMISATSVRWVSFVLRLSRWGSCRRWRRRRTSRGASLAAHTSSASPIGRIASSWRGPRGLSARMSER